MNPKLPWLYRPLLRPVSTFTMPKGVEWDYVEAPAMAPSVATLRRLPLSRYYYGLIAVSRAFTRDEQEHYGMECLGFYSEPKEAE